MIKYLKSFYTKLAFIMGIVMYFSYAIPTKEFKNFGLILISVFVALFLPFFTKISERIEQTFVYKTGIMFIGKLTRFLWQFVFNFFVILVLIKSEIINQNDLERVGGIYGAVALTSFASQGLQYLMLAMANRDIGNRYLNITIALSINVFLSAMASLGYENIQVFFIVFGLILGTIGAFYSLITDIRGILPSKGGVGIFFGTFNPVHKTHIEIIKKFIISKNLNKVYIHATVVPKIHQALIEEGIIKIAENKDGMRIYEKTEKADYHIDYFPTGNVFYEFENRVAMLKSAIKESNLEKNVEVLEMPEVYSKNGFHGIIKEIKKRHNGEKIYGLHGSDYGGMLVRSIYDENFITPCAIIRKDNVSATAIRAGSKNMTTDTVTEIRNILKDEYKKKKGDLFVFQGEEYVYNGKFLQKTSK